MFAFGIMAYPSVEMRVRFAADDGSNWQVDLHLYLSKLTDRDEW